MEEWPSPSTMVLLGLAVLLAYEVVEPTQPLCCIIIITRRKHLTMLSVELRFRLVFLYNALVNEDGLVVDRIVFFYFFIIEIIALLIINNNYYFNMMHLLLA